MLLDFEDAINLTIDCQQKLNNGINPKLDIKHQKQPNLLTFDDL
ncbi:hypothetical protein [Echinimonas agarilytica]|nr:hypothetical protein [Echinimonas agarilytica]